MNLIIDVGNTRIKLGVFNHVEMVHTEVITSAVLLSKVDEIIEKYSCNNAIISSVSFINKAQLESLSFKINLMVLTTSTKIPFINNYKTPKTLGVDRIALMAAAVSNFPEENVLVIDAGTCITYDFINAEKKYYGGAISPGLQMRYRALGTFTQNLPLLKPKDISLLYGDSTETSIHSGVINGVINEIDSVINQYKEKNEKLTVVLTGGDVNFLSNKLKNSIFANPIFLLEGLNTILTYNL
ncbi:type III pantothenate kinase [Lutibacter sp.]